MTEKFFYARGQGSPINRRVKKPAVRKHTVSIYRRLNVNDRRRAVEKAKKIGILSRGV